MDWAIYETCKSKQEASILLSKLRADMVKCRVNKDKDSKSYVVEVKEW